MNLKDTNSLYRDQQFAGSEEEAHRESIEGLLKNLHTSLPGVIQSFDSTKQTATVQPALKRIWTDKGPLNLPLCVDVPVCFPGGGGFWLTFPVVAGDECILLFSERCIDLWYRDGGIQEPYRYRHHDLSDAVAFVGVTSQPRKLSALQTTGAELRNTDRSTYFRMENGTIYIKGNIQLTGGIVATQDVVANGVSLDNHKHSDPQGGTTGVPL